MARMVILKILNFTRTLVLVSLMSFLILSRSGSVNEEPSLLELDIMNRKAQSTSIDNNQDSLAVETILIDKSSNHEIPIFSIGRLSSAHF